MPVYEPREDSWLLQEAVKKYSHGNVLDVGTGSGIQAVTARKLKRVKTVTAVDIQPDVVAHCKKTLKKVRCLHSDLFSNLKHKRYDTIIFNPPYLPEDGGPANPALIGGKRGHETLVRFLNEAGDHLTPDGHILVVFSSHTKKDVVDQAIQGNLYDVQQVGHQHVSFEDLYCYLLSKNETRRSIERKRITNLRPFDEGWRGVVYTGLLGVRELGVKVRSPANNAPPSKEARWLALVNKKRIGPKLRFKGKNWLAYDFVEGQPIAKWLPGKRKTEVRRVLAEVLDQCFTLDKMGIAKEEMSNPYKHVLVRESMAKGRAARKRSTKNASLSVVLIDFERAHKTTKPKNVTQFYSYIRNLNRSIGLGIDEGKLLEATKAYADRPGETTFRKVLHLAS